MSFAELFHQLQQQLYPHIEDNTSAEYDQLKSCLKAGVLPPDTVFSMPLFLKSIKDEDEGLCLGMAKLSSVQPLDASILVDVCSHGLTELCKYLIKRFQLDPSWNGNACLLAACERGHLKTVKLLLKDPRVDPGLHNSLALQRAAFYGHQDVVMFLLRDSRVQPKDAHLVQRMQSMKL